MLTGLPFGEADTERCPASNGKTFISNDATVILKSEGDL